MKKIIIAAALLAVAGTQGAKAGDREWAVVGKVLTGIAAADIISHAVAGPTYYQSSYYYAPAPTPVVVTPPVCYTPPVVYRPAPVVYAPRPVVYAPAPVVYAPRPVVYRPAPVVVSPVMSVGFGFGHRVHHGRW